MVDAIKTINERPVIVLGMTEYIEPELDVGEE
jgi:hypothetical protein